MEPDEEEAGGRRKRAACVWRALGLALLLLLLGLLPTSCRREWGAKCCAARGEWLCLSGGVALVSAASEQQPPATTQTTQTTQTNVTSNSFVESQPLGHEARQFNSTANSTLEVAASEQLHKQAPIHNGRNEINKQAAASAPADPNNHNNNFTRLAEEAPLTGAQKPQQQQQPPQERKHQDEHELKLTTSASERDNGALALPSRSTKAPTTKMPAGASAEAGRRERKQTMTNDVLCNSRCECLEVEFARRPRDRLQADKTGNEREADERAELAAKPNSGQMSSDKSELDKDYKTASSAGKQAAAELNQIALIEFGQDYSFDETPGTPDELAEPPDDRASAAELPLTASNARLPEPDGDAALTGSGAPLMWLPPSALELAGAGGRAQEAATSGAAGNQLGAAAATKLADQVGAGSGDRATIKMAGRAADQSSGLSARASARQKAAALLDPLNPSFITLPAGGLNRNYTARANTPAALTPLNGHALLLPSFKQKPKKVQLQANPASAPALELSRRLLGNSGGSGSDSMLELLPHHHQHRHHAQQQQQELDDEQQQQQQQLVIEKLSPLRAVNLSDRKLGELSMKELERARETNLTQLLIESLGSIELEGVQSVSLRQNNIKFELWTQLYSLLLTQLRTHLHRLDLSHNSLVKLGVTFTGYIEHHFVYQLIKSNGSDTSWPFSVAPSPAAFTATSSAGPKSSSNSLNESSSQPAAASQSGYMKLLSQFKLSTSSTSALPAAGANSKRLFRRPLLGDGRVYNAVRAALPLMSRAGASALNSSFSPLIELGSLQASRTENSTSDWASSNYQQLVQLLLHQPAQLRALDLSHNRLKWLINDQFRVLKRLQALRLDHNKIRFIHQQAFNGLVELKYVNLNFNRLQTIYMEQFQTNYKLLALFLRANYLTYLRAGSLASLAQLKRLDLARNKFTILSSNAFVGLESLELLNLSSNSFVNVPSASFHPLVGSLKRLDLADNQLAQLMPGAFFHLEQLEQLALDHNQQLVSIDRGAFWDLGALSWVSLGSSSQLLEVNAQAFVGVPQLKTIQLDECPLLERRTRQMLENITAANTMRTILKQQQQQNQMVQAAELSAGSSSTGKQSTELSSSQLSLDTKATPAGEQNSSSPRGLNSSAQQTLNALLIDQQQQQQQQQQQEAKPNSSNKLFASDESASSYQQQMSIQLQRDEKNATQKITKYFYCLGALALCVAALKLVFKFSSTRRYLELRGRRRRVYQSSAHGPLSSQLQATDCALSRSLASTKDSSASEMECSSSSSSSRSSENSSSSSSYRSRGSSLSGSLASSRRRARASSTDSSSPLRASSSFSLAELRPQNVIKQRRLASGRANSLPSEQNCTQSAPQRAGCNERAADESIQLASELELAQLAHSSSYSAPCCPDCLTSQLELEREQLATGARHQLPCCGQPAPQLNPTAAYDNDELLRELASASGLSCDLEHANCSHCYQSAVAAAHHFQHHSAQHSALPECCARGAQGEQLDYYATEPLPLEPEVGESKASEQTVGQSNELSEQQQQPQQQQQEQQVAVSIC